MTISIDTKTIVLAIILVDIFMIVLIVSYRNVLKDRSLKLFLSAKIFQIATYILWAAGLSMAGMADAFPLEIIALVAGNILFIIAIALESLAVLMLYGPGRSRKKIVYYVMAAAFGAAYSLFYFMGAGQGGRIALISLFCITLIAYPAAYLLANKYKSYLQRVVGFLYLLVMAGFFIRVLIVAGVFGTTSAVQEEAHSWVNFALFLMMILSGTGYFLLAKEQADIRLLERANTDSLTGVLNRRAFAEQGRRVLHYFERKKEPVSFLIFDIDEFKRVNDTFGHYVGDTVLKDVSEMVLSSLRAYDYLGRYGGDEFAVLLPGTGEEDSDVVADRLRRVVEAQAIYEHTKLRITICIGLVTTVPQKETNIEALYRQADGALYEAKLLGGNSVVRSGKKIPESDLL